jgi:DNA repair exonuclease SbcCD ATPase subunit
MYTEINQRLEEAQQGIYRLRKIDSMLKELQNEQLSLERKLSEMKDVLDKEDLDVKKLEEKSLANIFYSVLGSLPEHVEKEQREALAAKLKYDQAARDLEEMKHEISKLNSEREKYLDCERKYDSLHTQKKDMLMKSDPEKAQRLLNFSEQLSASKNTLKEINEAISAGRNVISSLDSALSSLDSAEGWGVWDMLGGGLISDLAKHSHIDDAKCEAERVQTLLRRFKTELADVKISDDIRIEIGGFSKFADFFFDGLIADWFMQSKIQNSHESVSQVRSQVQSVMSKLSRLEDQESSSIKKVEMRINDLITKA